MSDQPKPDRYTVAQRWNGHYHIVRADGAPAELDELRLFRMHFSNREEAEAVIEYFLTTATREVAPAGRADVARAAAPPATEAQVRYILHLLADRRRSGDAGGFYSGPTDREGVERLSRSEASTYIDSLTGNY